MSKAEKQSRPKLSKAEKQKINAAILIARNKNNKKLQNARDQCLFGNAKHTRLTGLIYPGRHAVVLFGTDCVALVRDI